MTETIKLVRDGAGWEPVLPGDCDRLAREHLERPEGYLVDDVRGHAVGVVEEVEQDVLVVAAGGWLSGERRRIPIEAVVEIHPDQLRLVVERLEECR